VVSEYESPCVLAVDIGTSAVKAGLFDSQARAVSGTETVIPHTQTVAADGTSEEDADQIRRAVESAIGSVLEKAKRFTSQIVGVGFDCMASTVLGVDSAGKPLTPVYTYADTRTAPDVERLREELDLPDVYDRTGVIQHTSYLPGRIRWLERTEPEIAKQIDRYVDLSTYMFSIWFGRQDVKSSYCVASWSGLLNRHELNTATAGLPWLICHSFSPLETEPLLASDQAVSTNQMSQSRSAPREPCAC
jgi:gluconokinase